MTVASMWQARDFGTVELLCDRNIVEALQIHPKDRAGSEPLPKPQRRITSDGAFALYDLRDAVGRHAKLARQFGWGDADFGEFTTEDFAQMIRSSRHGWLLEKGNR